MMTFNAQQTIPALLADVDVPASSTGAFTIPTGYDAVVFSLQVVDLGAADTPQVVSLTTDANPGTSWAQLFDPTENSNPYFGGLWVVLIGPTGYVVSDTDELAVKVHGMLIAPDSAFMTYVEE